MIDRREIEKIFYGMKAVMQGWFPTWHYLQVPLTSTSWDGDSYSTTAKTLIDLSAVFGVPAGVKAVLFRTAIRDSASSTADCILYLSPESQNDRGPAVDTTRITNDVYVRGMLTVPCDANGDVYYQVVASGASTMDVVLQIWGYFY